ncbi:MAG: HD domain-containing protein [Lachnospiraceae bacterium]|nr:HD domain-containing protein [Lachnospiraceae bacterium]
MRKDIRDIIIKYGNDVLISKEFKNAFEQTHHLNTTVGDHTLGVTAEAIKFCLKHHLTDDITLHNVVTSCLCHDLGILGRYDKFKNAYQCLKGHPKQSAEEYVRLTGEANDRVLDSIRCHMFPLKLCVPRYKESWILTLADKVAASKEKMGKAIVTPEDAKELIRIVDENNSEDEAI